MKTFKLILFFPLLIMNTYSYSISSEQAFIQGFAKWQASRIERIVLDEALLNITEDPYVQRFFPQTAENIQMYDGVSSKRLIPLMQHYIQEDINQFKQIIESCIPLNINRWFDDKNVDIAERSKSALTLYHSLRKLASKVNKDSNYTTSMFKEDVCKGKLPTTLVKIPVEKDETKKAKVIEEITENLVSTKVKPEQLPEVPDSVNNLLTSNYLGQLIDTIISYQKISDTDQSYTIRVHQMILAIEQFGGISGKHYVGFQKLKNASLFFAALADAADKKSSDAVVAVLETYINDKDAYMRKRLDNAYYSIVSVSKFDQKNEKFGKKTFSSTCNIWKVIPCPDSIFISSYYGLSYTKIPEFAADDREWNFRAFGPVGVEMKLFTYKSSPLTLNLAPIDLGNYITNELKSEEYTARFEDILAPSVFLSYSFSSKPVSILLGYQKNIKVDKDFETEGPFVSVAFDLPIFTLY